MKPYLDLTGKKFGNLTVVENCGSNGKNIMWRVACKCGSSSIKMGKDISRRGGAKFCGAKCPLMKAAISQKNKTHGMSKHPAFAVWRSMKARCLNPTHAAYKNYGGRGITIDADWQESFSAFWEDMGAEYRKGFELDRIDNNGGYTKTNCRWVSRKTNCRNKRNSWIGKAGLPSNFIEIAREHGINRSTLYYRLKAGIPWATLIATKPNVRNTFK